jgi:hypothetical protein
VIESSATFIAEECVPVPEASPGGLIRPFPALMLMPGRRGVTARADLRMPLRRIWSAGISCLVPALAPAESLLDRLNAGHQILTNRSALPRRRFEQSSTT